MDPNQPNLPNYPFGYVNLAGSAKPICIYPFLEPGSPAFATSLPSTNQAVVKAKSSPVSFLQSGLPSADGSTVTLQGTFGDWQLVDGGFSHNLRLSLPITNWTMTGEISAAGNLATAVIEVDLNWAYPMSWVEPKPVNPVPLAKDSVSVVSMDTAPIPVTQLTSAILTALLQEWLQANPQAFTPFFGSILSYIQQLPAAAIPS